MESFCRPPPVASRWPQAQARAPPSSPARPAIGPSPGAAVPIAAPCGRIAGTSGATTATSGVWLAAASRHLTPSKAFKDPRHPSGLLSARPSFLLWLLSSPPKRLFRCFCSLRLSLIRTSAPSTACTPSVSTSFSLSTSLLRLMHPLLLPRLVQASSKGGPLAPPRSSLASAAQFASRSPPIGNLHSALRYVPE